MIISLTGFNDLTEIVEYSNKYNELKDKFKIQFWENIFSLFQIDYNEFLNIDFIFPYKLHIAPSEYDNMDFFRVQYIIDNYNKEQERKEEEHKAQEAEYKTKYNPDKAKKDAMKDYKVPKMPNVPKIN